MAGTRAPQRQQEAPAGPDPLPRLRQIPFVAAGVTLALLLSAYLASLLLADAPRPLAQAGAPFGLDAVFWRNLVLCLLIAYSVAVGLLEFRTAPQERERLRSLLDCDDATFQAALRSALPGRSATAASLGLGALFGLAVDAVSRSLGAGAPGPPDLHELWNGALMALLFALLGLLTLWGARSTVVYSRLAQRHARVHLLDPRAFDLFAARGLRLALFWFLGSGIALLLALEAETPAVVLSVIGATFAVGLANLVLPSLGIHRRMREAKEAELQRVRGELEARLAALRAGDTARAAELPALLAWEARVAAAPEWPLRGTVLLRFALLVLIPVGSWLGGALFERLVDSALD